ncbi:DUF4241 domain-containing protein [Streptomyces avidinii]|uniref:Uncharacterized protein n=1 Tax=Streptomyces avidinii TaxID=1895 RepID=A0ABS4L716_STRAV|nr:DUF4241 domain-containing protein [Streptomyces avidinii]MBP2037875.1 hypothetical protein [Streptomyces avidinii]GGZ08034.1 hypothetical protein GCM10010343_37750 [Streptomyces avidinii]
MVVEVEYARAWDLEARAPWRPMSVGEARERDAAGLPYVVVYREPGREVPLEVRLVSWRDHYVGLWVYDAQGRRTYDLDMRPASGGELMAFATTGDGTYPVWVGRSGTGEVVAVVVLVEGDARTASGAGRSHRRCLRRRT